MEPRDPKQQDRQHTAEELSLEELDDEQAAELPDREALSAIMIGPPTIAPGVVGPPEPTS